MSKQQLLTHLIIAEDLCDDRHNDLPISVSSLPQSNVGAVRDSETTYRNRIREIPVLSEAEEQVLTRLVASQRGTPEAKQALNTLTECNLRLVFYFAKNFIGQGLDISDLVQEGTLGLIKAIESFNPELGFRLATYAGNWIRQSMQRAVANQGKSLRRPVNIQEKQRQISRITAELEQTLMRYPTPAEVAKAVSQRYGETTVAAIDDLLVHNPTLVSLDQPLEDDDSSCLEDFVSAEDEPITAPMHQADLHAILEGYLAQLPPRSRQIVELLNGWNGQDALSLTDIADQLHLSRERIRQLNKESMHQLLELAQHDQLADYLHH